MALAMQQSNTDDAQPRLSVRLDEVKRGEQLREAGLDEDHIRSLMETWGSWPPVVIWGPDNVVIDGLHRLAAADRLGVSSVEALRFTGTSEEAYVEAVRRNARTGLRLTVSDRTRAVHRLLNDHPEWSDRRIAEACAVSAKTVVQARENRRATSPYDSQLAQPEIRVGTDGRCRPLKSAMMREKIVQALEANPTGSLRSIAGAVGVSPETVRNVRKGRGLETVGPELRPVEAKCRLDADNPRSVDGGWEYETQAPAPSMQLLLTEQSALRWQSDTAMSSRADAMDFAKWFEASEIGEEWYDHAQSVPVNRIYEVADEARRRARCWSEFAHVLEERIPRPSR